MKPVNSGVLNKAVDTVLIGLGLLVLFVWIVG